MPKIFNLPARIPEGNYREAELLSRGFMDNVFEHRTREVTRNKRANRMKEAMRRSPHLFGKMSSVDTYGNEDWDIKDPRITKQSRTGNPTKTTSDVTEMSGLEEYVMAQHNQRNQGTDDVTRTIRSIANGKGILPGLNLPQGGTNGLITKDALADNSAIVNAGVNGINQSNGLLPNPVGQGTVLKPNDLITKPEEKPLITRKDNVSQSLSEGGSQSSKQDYSISANEGGGSFGRELITKNRTITDATALDSVNKNMDDLKTYELLFGTDAQGNRQNNIYTKDVDTKQAFLDDLNEQMQSRSDVETTKIDKLSNVTVGSDSFKASEGQGGSTSVINRIIGSAATLDAGKGGSKTQTIKQKIEGVVGYNQKDGEYMELDVNILPNGDMELAANTGPTKVNINWDDGAVAQEKLTTRLDPFNYKVEATDKSNTGFIIYDDKGVPSAQLKWNKDIVKSKETVVDAEGNEKEVIKKGDWISIGLKGGNPQVLPAVNAMFEQGFSKGTKDSKELKPTVR